MKNFQKSARRVGTGEWYLDAVKAPPEGLDEARLAAAVSAQWGFDVDSISYMAVGGGSHHWLLRTAEAGYRFLTADDLNTKPWLGDDPDSTFAGLGAAFRTARLLRDSGLDFVVAPIPAGSGDLLVRIDQRFSASVFPYIVGRTGTFGEAFGTRDRHDLLAMWARLHQATAQAPHRSLDVPGRAALDDGGAWSGGPYSERAREWLAANRDLVAAALDRYDQLAREAATRDFVITHGEPHGGNLIRTEDGLRLIDWDTVALAPRERDLWMLGGDLSAYVAATGRDVDETMLGFYRLAWLVTDAAAFIAELRRPHKDDANTGRAWRALEITGETLSSTL